MTKQSADNTIRARTLSQTTKVAAEKGGVAMVRMTDAMEKIRAASEGPRSFRPLPKSMTSSVKLQLPARNNREASNKSTRPLPKWTRWCKRPRQTPSNHRARQ